MSAVVEPIRDFAISELLNNGGRYSIPIYQRNYAWGAKEIEQLIQDIIDYAVVHPESNYYIGTLVVAKDENIENLYQTVDGQQRLTTLFILSAAIKNNYPAFDLKWLASIPLSYASRERSQLTLAAALIGDFNHEADPAIRAAYDICVKALTTKTADNKITVKEFAGYLYSKVVLLRVPLPPGIDLNHYFEIMNSRGEQLEKHEILKAELMECFQELNTDDRIAHEQCFDLIWTACANMEKYVQYGFSAVQRQLIFGNDHWNRLDIFDFNEFVFQIAPTLKQTGGTNRLSIDEIIAAKSFATKKENVEENPDRFNTVVNFPNFLLHVLRIQMKSESVALDDKRLLDLFKAVLKKQEDKRKFVQAFIYNLLKSKFLFDKYIIKREFTAGTDRWSLKSLRWYAKGRGGYINSFNEEQGDSMDSDNRRLLMLLATFHVSIPSMPYKYWLNAAMNYLFQQPEVISNEYIAYLEHIAKSFVFDRILARAPREYFEMTYKQLHPVKRSKDDLDLSKLRYGRTENNLLFNFTDYLIWLRDKNKGLDQRVEHFEFSFRSSVEHYYPQHPLNNDVLPLEEEWLHAYGNLCLISHEKNSKLNNYSPTAKKDHYGDSAALDSLKQFLMMQYKHWEKKEIAAHDHEMELLLTSNMDSDFRMGHGESRAQRWFREYQAKDRVTLVRALLCFADCTKPAGSDKYQLFDFDFIRRHQAYELFENYININNPPDIQAIINDRLTDETFKPDWRYLFVKYPEVIAYCEQGLFLWHEVAGVNSIALLKAGKRSLYGVQDIYLLLLSLTIKIMYDYRPYVDQDMLHLPIGISNGQYFIPKNKKEAQSWLHVWNNENNVIEYDLAATAHGNNSAIKRLKEFGWVNTGNNKYIFKDTKRLIKLSDHAAGNIEKLTSRFNELMRFGLAIKS
ncbi:MAG: hypothetical protein JWR54_1052 [Mucilaginibacter sp.]|nr:hypothetical protein [Mucilaginibacter sp.]